MFEKFCNWLVDAGTSAWNNILSSSFVAGELASFMFVAVASGAATLAVTRLQERRYTSWTLRIIDGKENPAQQLYAAEVKQYLESDFELWKMVKSVCSAEFDVRLPTVSKALGEWVYVDRTARMVTVDQSKAVEKGDILRRGKVVPPTGKVFFVSRHKGAKEWSAEKGFVCEVIDHLDVNIVKPGDQVWGTLPIHVAAAVCEKGATFKFLAIDVTEEMRGKELTKAQMKSGNARLESFAVRRLP